MHVVAKGDTLYTIARKNNVTVADLVSWNKLSDNTIYPGQRIRIFPWDSQWVKYTVKPKDTLYQIALRHDMSVAAIKEVNELTTDAIYPNQKLLVPAGSILNHSSVVNTFYDLAFQSALPYGGDIYYFHKPNAVTQLSESYFELVRYSKAYSPETAFGNARLILEQLDEAAGSGYIDTALSEWFVVIDPGHGGYDPGVIVESSDGSGNSLFVCEDEYVYDIALRLYVLLKSHDAKVFMTILSPNHLLRHTFPPYLTLVNEKNEVFNSENIAGLPTGDRDSLRNRVELGARFIDQTPSGKTLFISLHADNTPDAAKAASVWYYEDDGYADDVSKAFAQKMVPYLGSDAYVRGSSFVVLQENPFLYKVLIEVRNIAYQDHSWALRYEEFRQQDAVNIAEALLAILK